MVHRLPGGGTDVEPDVVAVWGKTSVQKDLHLVHQAENVVSLVPTEIPPGTNQPAWCDEAVSLTNQVLVTKREGGPVGGEP